MRYLKELSFPLKATLVSAVVASAFLATLVTLSAVGIPAYRSFKKTISELWMELAKQNAKTGKQLVLRYFESAPKTLKVIGKLGERNEILMNTEEQIFDICYAILQENPEFRTLYFTTKEGKFIGVFKKDTTFFGVDREQNSAGNGTEKTYKKTGSGWAFIKEEATDYDPRTRPFWATGKKNPQGAWTDVYRFRTTEELGFSYTVFQEAPGRPGYWTVDYELKELNQFLDLLNVGDHGSAFVLEKTGMPIAESTSKIKGAIPPYNLLQEVWEKWREKGEKASYISLKEWIFYLDHFPKESHIPWAFLTAINEEDVFLPTQRKALLFLSIGILPCLIFILISAFFFGAISRRLLEIASEMDKVGNLNIKNSPSDTRFSRIREVNLMNRSLTKMKVGLQSFAKYVPIDLVKKLLASGKAAELGGEKKEISVLFADLKQFTSISELLDPSEIAEILKNFLTIATEEVQKEHGIVDKYMGDSCMALWGAPDPVSDHAAAACRMALKLKSLTAHHPLMSHKIGINSGLAMVGNFGAETRMDFTAIGDVVNVASRLEKLSSSYETQILVGKNTFTRVQSQFLFRPIDYVILKGRKEATLIYELLTEKSAASPALVQAAHTYTSALELYFQRKFQEALSLFQEANRLFGGKDLPSSLLEKRCHYFCQSPPPAEWRGEAPLLDLFRN